jgi:hypothetical protein
VLSKYAFGKKKTAAVKEARKELAREAKRAKLDPTLNLPVTERQAQLHAQQASMPVSALSVTRMQSLSRDDLKARLAAKLAQLRGGRKDSGAEGTEGSADAVSRKRKREDDAEERKRKLQQRKEASVGRPQHGGSGNDDDDSTAAAAAGSSNTSSNSNGGPIFSKFDFSTTPRSTQKKGGPTPAQLLQKIQRDKERTEQLKVCTLAGGVFRVETTHRFPSFCYLRFFPP